MPERFRDHGHRYAHLDPLTPAPTIPGDWPNDPDLRAIWCGTFAVELAHVEPDDRREWLVAEFETTQRTRSTDDARRALHARLVAAEAVELFLHGKHVGAKRFSLEGAESVLPMLDAMIATLDAGGARELIVGLGHRGRLNLLVNLLGLPRPHLLALVRGDHDEGDVPYHQGRDALVGNVHVVFAPNPSHLEAIDPVVLGRARARQDALDTTQVVPLLIHGDAGFTGQGIVAECFNLARTPGYATGGTIHLVVDNQLGFTTDARSGRSTARATDLARAFGAPILHVNGDDPEAAQRAGALAARWRQRFGADIVLDLLCFRRRGHNESDEPRFTQPQLYAAIDAHPSVRELFAGRLATDGVLTAADAHHAFADALASWRSVPVEPAPPTAAPRVRAREVPAIERVALADLAARLAALPAGVQAHPKVIALLEERARRVAANDTIDWATAETLALASVLVAGGAVRLSGQDVRRGTFSQRHAVVVDTATGAEHLPLATLGRFTAWDSPLSEAAVLGFDYGYAVAAPQTLVIWEAQYGDFINGAQTVVDEFLATGATKWGQHANLVVLLPHGAEGQGPDHSYARLDRFLALAAGDNLRICQPTTAAQMFHLLRSQVGATSPLVVFTPKGGLRAAAWSSPVDDLASGAFHEVLPDARAASRVLVCSGRIYRDLVDARTARRRDDVAIVRLEQLHPLSPAFADALTAHPNATLVWVQEEPRNLGAWPSLADRLRPLLGDRPLGCIARPPSGSPASGSVARHRREQAVLIEEAFR